MAIQNRKKSLKVIVTGIKVVSEEFTVRKARLAADLFKRKHGIEADTIDGRKVMGYCTHSGRVILEGDDWEHVCGQHAEVIFLVKENNSFVRSDPPPHHD